MPLAILPAQILWINIINDGFPNFALAFENEEYKAMEEKPIKKSEPIINKKMKTIIFFAGIFNNLIILAIFIYYFNQGMELSYLRTFIFAVIAFKSLTALFSLRNINLPIWRVNHSTNNFLIYSFFISFALLLSAIYFSPLQKILSTVPLNTASWLAIISISALSIIIIEVAKYYFIAKLKIIKQN
jgi:Ca2+-transporting ATPase